MLLGTIYLGESLTVRQLIAVAMVVGGVLLLAMDDGLGRHGDP